MTPEATLADVMAKLRAAGIDPVAVWADGPNNALHIRVKVRSREELAALAGLGYGWDLSVAVVVEAYTEPAA